MKVHLKTIAKILVLSSAVVLILLAPSTSLAQVDYTSFQAVTTKSYITVSDDGTCNLEQIGLKSDKTVKRAAAFKVVPALDGSENWSFESVSKPGYYLRHENGRLKVSKLIKTDQGFKDDASFRTAEALTGAGDAMSLEAVNMPGTYVVSEDGELWLKESDDTTAFKRDATFKMGAALSR